MTQAFEIPRSVSRNVVRDLVLSSSTGALDAYAVGGFEPEFVADFAGTLNSGTEYYRSGGADTTFSSVFTHSGLVLPATMTDSDGNLKWAPHNLVLNSASPATQSITVVSGADYTVEITGSGSVALSGAGSGTVTAGNPVEITASTTSLTLTVTGSPTTMWAYRSDLGGMVNNPDTSSTYVATTGSAKFFPRRNHYLYNGSTYDNAGILIEPAAATNLVTQSNDLSTTWALTALNRAQLGTPGTGPDGVSNSAQLIEVGSAAGTSARGYFIGLTSTAVAHTYSVYLKKASGGTGWAWLATFDATGGLKYSYFDLNTGAVGTAASGHTLTIENVGSGWYRCGVVNTYASTSTMRVYVGMATSDGSSVVDQATYPQGTGWFYHYGSQSEVGSVPTSYIPTAGTTVTRAAETLTVAGSSLPYSATAMSFQQQGRMNFADDEGNPTLTFFDWRDGGAYLGQRIQTNGSNTGLFVGYSVLDGSFDVTDDYVPGINVSYNNASRHTNDLVQAAKQGSAHTADSDPTATPAVSSGTLRFGSNSSVGSPPFTVALFRAWGADIGQSGIETAST